VSLRFRLSNFTKVKLTKNPGDFSDPPGLLTAVSNLSGAYIDKFNAASKGKKLIDIGLSLVFKG
jgi:hypothetical protein